jgi:taurine transport system permease protein
VREDLRTAVVVADDELQEDGVEPEGSPAPSGRSGRATRLALLALSLGVLLTTWWIVTELEIWSPVILPGPVDVWDAFIQSVTTHNGQRGLSGYFLWEHLWASVWRIANGVFWAIAVGIPLGLALASWRSFRVIVEPYVNFLRSLPPLAYFSLLIIWFGIDDTSKIWLLFLAAFPPITLATAAGVHNVRRDRLDAGRTLGASRLQLVRFTVLPSILPDLFTGLRVAIGFAWTTIVAAETSNGIPGIGGLAWATKKELRTDVAILCVIVIGITAICFDQLVKLAERKLVPWKGKA